MSISAPSEDSALSAVERLLQRKFNKDSGQRLPSTAAAAAPSDRVVQLALPDEMRGRMPFTKDKFLVKENPHRVQWEREVRKFLRNLSPQHGHRVSAAMIYEWATGLKIAELMAYEKANPDEQKAQWRADLRHLNFLLREYFGDSYMTYIAGKKVPNCYRVKPGYLIRRHRPVTLTLYAEYCEGTLNP